MEKKYTKGSWSACCLSNRPHFVFGEGGHVTICGIFKDQDLVNNLSDEEVRANAKLIAAAPDMIDALIKIQSFLKKEWPEFEYNEFLTECVDIDSLINKATL